MRRRSRRSRAIAFAGLLGWATAFTSPPAHAEEISGQITIVQEGLELADAGAIVVFVAPIDGETIRTAAPRPRVQILQRGARFEPDFLAVSVGQAIDMPNDDVIYHNVFSYSEPNEFDLGLYGSGETPHLRLEHAGLVRIYCSIHEDMDGLIFVAPNPLFAVPDEKGRYSIADVPPGRYELHVWSERIPELERSIEIEPGTSLELSLELGQPSS
jgi:plastocyanin